jgi:hypothetical protein
MFVPGGDYSWAGAPVQEDCLFADLIYRAAMAEVEIVTE